MRALNYFKKLLSILILFVSISVVAQDPVPVVSYTFENQKPADDGGLYSGNLYGNATIVQMIDGNYALHTGAGYMDLTATMGQTVLAGLNGSYSFSIDVCVGATNSLASFCWAYAFANSTTQYLGLINTAGNANWYYELKNSTMVSSKSNASLTTNVWHNIAVVQNGAINSIYIDGVLKASSSMTIKPASFASAVTACYLGRSPFAGDAIMTNTFVDNFKVFNVALAPAQISTIYNAAKNLATTTNATVSTNISRIWESTGNPVVKHKYTADPAAFVYKDTLFIFTGQDAAGGQTGYNIPNWCCFATTDMKHFWEYNTPLKARDFTWATQNAAWAGQVVERNGKFYWYTSSNTTGIGVAVADRPEGPYKDALGRAFITNANSPGMTHSWRTIDPAVFIDDDGQAWLFWGNGACWVCKLNADMISYDATFGTKMVAINGAMDFPYTEAPWVHKKNGLYYLSFATGFPERIEYAVATSPAGPYTYKGILNEIAGNSNTNHQAIVQFKNNWYFIYHNGGIQTDGGSFSRSVCIDKLEFDENGMYKPVIMTTKGVDMLTVPNVNAIQEISKSRNCPFVYDKMNHLITLKEGNSYQIVDTLGRVMKAGLGTSVSVERFKTGVFVISNGNQSYKFIR
ncbi:MAG: family 43 glycosylhydrolase [Paludibacter sp.]